MMKRTIPGGRVDTVYSRTNDGKEVVATNITELQPEEEVAEAAEAVAEETPQETEEKES
jgi:hypothetical protein